MLWSFNPHTSAIFSIIPDFMSVLFHWEIICTSWKIKVALNFVKVVCYHANHNLEISEK